MDRILLFGDTRGVPELVRGLPRDRIAGIVGASIRPRYHDALRPIAEKLDVPFIIQPLYSDRESYGRFTDMLTHLSPDGVICHSYAMLIRQEVLALVGGAAFNVHFSLLPRNKGPNPVQWALIHGETQTGVTVHVMDAGFDTGAVVAQRPVQIAEADTWVTLLRKLDIASKALLEEVLPHLVLGEWVATPQASTAEAPNGRIGPESFEIDFACMTDRDVFNLVRAQVAPLSGAYISSTGGTVRFPEYLSMAEVAQLRKTYAA